MIEPSATEPSATEPSATEPAGGGQSPVVVTLSAPYGARGSVIGPAVAAELGIPFLDRAIPVTVARNLEVPLDAVEARERDGSFLGRFVAALARLPVSAGSFGVMPDPDALTDDRTYRSQIEEVIWSAARSTGGVFLGRMGAAVLGNHPRALHVRLDGSVEARIAQAQQVQGVDEEAAREGQHRTDQARHAYARHLYHLDPQDPSLYHLMIDSTVIPTDVCIALIVAAARARAGYRRATPGPAR
ncbi:MAG: AAA family ATPase [Acidimicrobiales bacterium]